MMKQLPPLQLIDNCNQYIVAVDNIIDHRSEREVFCFCVMGYTDNEFYVVQQQNVINNFYGRHHSPYQQYCRELARFYNTQILTETK